MKNALRTVLLPVLLASFLAPLSAQDSGPFLDDSPDPELTPAPAPAPAPEPAPVEPKYNNTEFGAFAALSHTVTTSTGVAMSPLLGMGVLGAWQYFQTDAHLRDQLPWYTSPWVWGICLGVFLLISSKDTIGAVIPELAKKPITILEVLQGKASALIVLLAVIPPSVLNEFSNEWIAQTGFGGTTAVSPFFWALLLIPLAIGIFIVVWIASHAFNCIKILSPSSLINSFMTMVKGFLLSVFAILAMINPWVGLVVSLLIVLVSVLIFGWAFRWNVFGMVVIKDFLTGDYQRPFQEGDRLKGFVTGNFPNVKPRTWGEVTREGDELVFSWRPWLIFPMRQNRVNVSNTETSVRKGIFLPSITLYSKEIDRHHSIIDLRPRFRKCADEVRAQLRLHTTSENFVLGGLKASWLWLKEQLRRGAGTLAGA